MIERITINKKSGKDHSDVADCNNLISPGVLFSIRWNNGISLNFCSLNAFLGNQVSWKYVDFFQIFLYFKKLFWISVQIRYFIISISRLLVLKLKIDGFVKSPTSALCCISQSFNVRKVHSLRDRRIADDYKICTPWIWTFYETV